MKTLVRKNIFYKSALDDQTTGAKIDKMFGDRGVFGGGYIPPSPIQKNTIDYITISTPGNATDFGDLTQTRGYLGATSDGSRGVFGGGRYPFYANTIDYIPISTPGNATDFGDLTEARNGLAATSGD